MPEETAEAPIEARPAPVPTAAVPAAAAPDAAASETASSAAGRPALEPPPRPIRILILVSSHAANYTDVAAALQTALSDRYELEVRNLADAGESEADPADAGFSAAIAIGADAAMLAGRRLEVPTVFCQILDYEPLLDQSDHLFGVEAVPPLDLQLESWKAIAPGVTSVGMVVAEGETELVEAADRAARSLDIELRPAFALTDHDAIYQFKRFAQSVDGIWLQPSGTILSPRSIREILDYSLTHGVHSIVFSEALLEWGALLSVGSDTSDVAAKVAGVVDRLLAGDTQGLARITPLGRVDSRVNADIVVRLGVAGPKAPEPAN